jgi:aminoacyl tRNA synthase complex-interacting multifunctional protein 1
MDEPLVTFLKTHAPNDAFEEVDPAKASQRLFPETAYTDSEKTEISQWLITASHLGSTVG